MNAGVKICGSLLCLLVTTGSGCGNTTRAAGEGVGSHDTANASSQSGAGSGSGGVGGVATGPASGTNTTGVGGAAGASGDPADCDCAPCYHEDSVVVACADQRYECVCEPVESAARDDHERLAACETELACPTATANLVGPGEEWTEPGCLFEALRDRRAGRYAFEHVSGDTAYQRSGWMLFVASDGSVLVAGTEDMRGLWLETAYDRSYLQPMRCSLVEPEFFDACLELVAGFYSGCTDAESWWTGCTPVVAECPPG